MLNEQQKLIKTADELRAAAGFPVSLKGEALPSLFVLSDERRLTNPLKVSENLTNSCGIILRHYHVPDRDRIAKDLLKISLEKGLTFLVAGDTNLATKIGADGIHLPENMIEGFNRPKNLRIVTAAVHSKTAITKAINAGVDAVLLSPVLKTDSHPSLKPLGIDKFGHLVNEVAFPVYALGGINHNTASQISSSGAAGIAAVGAFSGTS